MTDDVEKAVAFLNDKDAAIWSIPPELLPDYIEGRPEQAKPLIDSTERIAAIAAQLQQWEALDRAVKFLMACQQAVLDWWRNHTRSQAGAKSRERGISVKQAEDVIGFSDSVLSRWRQSLDKPEQYEERLRQTARRKAGLEVEESHRVNTGEYEWYTPERYIEAARTVMGGIDLDPASHDAAQQTVRAAHYFTAKDDGLSLDWYGRVWLNPPYSQPLMQNFVRKLVSEFASGNIEQAVMLTHNYTDTAWFHEAQLGAMLCFTRGRISFVGASGPPTQGQCFFYFGNSRAEFRTVFGAFGFIR